MAEVFKQIGPSAWVHPDIGSTAFPRKPPDWIAPYLLNISESAYRMGADHVRSNLATALSEIGVALKSDIPNGDDR